MTVGWVQDAGADLALSEGASLLGVVVWVVHVGTALV
jgi:hypothetical protein